MNRWGGYTGPDNSSNGDSNSQYAPSTVANDGIVPYSVLYEDQVLGTNTLSWNLHRITELEHQVPATYSGLYQDQVLVTNTPPWNPHSITEPQPRLEAPNWPWDQVNWHQEPFANTPDGVPDRITKELDHQDDFTSYLDLLMFYPSTQFEHEAPLTNTPDWITKDFEHEAPDRFTKEFGQEAPDLISIPKKFEQEAPARITKKFEQEAPARITKKYPQRDREVPVIKIPYWERITEDRGVTLRSWELGIAVPTKWKFSAIHYESWGPCLGFSESSIFALDACKDFQLLTQRTLSVEDQVRHIHWDLGDHSPDDTIPLQSGCLELGCLAPIPSNNPYCDPEGCKKIQLPKHKGGWGVYSLQTVRKPDLSEALRHGSAPRGRPPSSSSDHPTHLTSHSSLCYSKCDDQANVCAYGYLYCTTARREARKSSCLIPTSSQRMWFTLARFLFQAPLEVNNNQKAVRPRFLTGPALSLDANISTEPQFASTMASTNSKVKEPLASSSSGGTAAGASIGTGYLDGSRSISNIANIVTPRTTFIEASIFEYLDLGLSCALITGWFDPSRTPSMLGPTPIKALMISAVQKLAKKALRQRDKALRDSQNSRLPDGFDISASTSIAHPYDIPPRRLWDLKMNRVIPWYLIDNPAAKAPPPFIAISHSWVDNAERVFVETPIHRYAWPVPLPKGITLDAIREEVLVAFPDFRYCWLDVLCLRQEAEASRILKQAHVDITNPSAFNCYHVDRLAESILIKALCLERDLSSKDTLRAAEHRIDVPTIGNVYKVAKGVFRYFNGLGRRFCETNWDHPSHWLNRAWTLQEAISGSVDGGVAHLRTTSHLNLRGSRGGTEKRFRDFIVEIEGMTGESASVITLAQEMGRRSATSEIDKITGLSYLLNMPRLPTYKADISVPCAWKRSLWAMPKKHLLELLFNCPVVDFPGWTPSWDALSSLPPTFIPYPDLDLGSSRLADLRRNFFNMCGELGHPRSVMPGMFQTLTRYSAFEADSCCPKYPFARDQSHSTTDHIPIDGNQLRNDAGQLGSISLLRKRKRELNEQLDSRFLRDTSNASESHLPNDENDPNSAHDEGSVYDDVVSKAGGHMDREVRIPGWYLKVVSLGCTGDINYCLQVYTSVGETKDMNFFVSHDGVELNFAKPNSPPWTRNDMPQLQNTSKVELILFTRGLVPPGDVNHSRKGRTAFPNPHTRCSSWLVLKPNEAIGMYQKVGVLRSDATFSYQWMTEGLLRAHLNSGSIYIDTPNVDAQTEETPKKRRRLVSPIGGVMDSGPAEVFQ